MILNAENILFIGSILLFISVIIGKTGFRFGMPALLLFLGVGMLFGNDGLGIQFYNPKEAQFIGVMALSIILFSGGMDTKYKEIKPVLGPGIVLATFGVLLTTFITGYFIYFITGFLRDYVTLSLTESMLLAAVMSSTDSASVFSILRSKGLGLKERLRPVLELESGSNDPMAYMLTILLIQIIQVGDVNFVQSGTMLLIQLTVGGLLGYFLGRLTVWLFNRLNIENESLYSVLLLALVFFIFSFTDLLKGNGYLAVYISGLVVGNHKMVHKRSLTTFFDGLSWLFQIVMFLTLGLLVNPSELLPVAGIGLLIGIFMILFSRPISVVLCLLPFRHFSKRARAYISWVGLRGAVPIIFATYPLISGVENSRFIFNIVFFITIISLLVQGTTVSAMARWLHLAKAPDAKKNFDVALPDEIKTAMSEITVNDSILSHGNKLMDLTLPDNTLVVMVKRGEHFFVPKGHTHLQIDDKLLFITDNDEELKNTYKSLGINDYLMEKNQ
ncbi:potassium/proton antiporter [Coprobacter tertius]|uniref:Potassium/proton antiporter n=1 Tax=Coprobacter tertius TaxID=2944915 RepID=A0ABT1MHN8_9BACT|nr:potassium/proton antiporter [Coprobacter tertius]MCP9612148.1 potassium/proton antiporter [Coprobacter tertius]